MQTTVLPAFSDNYLFALEGVGGVVVVDPGDPDVIDAHLQERGLPLLAILVTHHHPDHIGGLAQLARHWPQARRIGPNDPRIPQLTEVVVDGDLIEVEGGFRFQVIATPGHTRTHIAYLHGDNLFCGDVLFSLGCGRVFEGTPEQMLATLDRLAALPATTRVYCAHEYTLANGRFAQHVDPDNQALRQRLAEVQALRNTGQPSIPTLLRTEQRCNPFLRCDDATIQSSCSVHEGRPLTTRHAVFAALRAWKNVF
jgi:hydroxyacylglutathione hydrolase